MKRRARTTLVHGAGTATLSPRRPGWHTLSGFDREDVVEVHLRLLPGAAHEPCNGGFMGHAVAVYPQHIDPDKHDSGLFRTNTAGWHRIRAIVVPHERGVQITTTWESAKLSRPPGASIAMRRAQHPAAEWWGWIEAPRNAPLAQRYEAARDLARYFILDQEDSNMRRALHELRSDPYPELSQLGLDNEILLVTLAERPETLTPDDWDVIQDVGRATLELLDEESAANLAA